MRYARSLPKHLLCLLPLAAVLSGALASVSQAQEKGSTIAAHDSKAPIDYAADRIELQDKQNRVLLTGNVDVTQKDLRLKADRTIVAYTNNGEINVQRIDATGNVHVTRGDENATSNLATYDFNRKIITLVGNVVLHRGQDVSRGERLVIDLNEHHSGFVGAVDKDGKPQRVTGTFSVAK